MPWALAMLPVQRKRHVRILSNAQPERRRDVSCWLSTSACCAAAIFLESEVPFRSDPRFRKS
jgi:hypothetical protein